MKKAFILTFIFCVLLANSNKTIANCWTLNPHLGICEVDAPGPWTVYDQNTYYMTAGTPVQVYAHFKVYNAFYGSSQVEADCGYQMWWDGRTSGEDYAGTTFSAGDNLWGNVSLYVTSYNAWTQLFATW